MADDVGGRGRRAQRWPSESHGGRRERERERARHGAGGEQEVEGVVRPGRAYKGNLGERSKSVRPGLGRWRVKVKVEVEVGGQGEGDWSPAP